MLDFLDEAPRIIALRGIHGKAKQAHIVMGLHCDMFGFSLEAVDIDLNPLTFLASDCELYGSGVLLVIDEFGIVVFNSHIGRPVDRVIPVPGCLGIHLLHLNTFLPGSLSQLVLYLSLHVEGLILDLLVDMSLAIVANHIDVQSIVGVLVPKAGFGEVLLIFGLGIV